MPVDAEGFVVPLKILLPAVPAGPVAPAVPVAPGAPFRLSGVPHPEALLGP